ncbi:MAG: hypothetical protein AABY00_00740 [Nanoarchaeota archaeon]
MSFTEEYIKYIFEKYKQDFMELEHYDQTREKLWKRKRIDITLPLRTIKKLKEVSKAKGSSVSRLIEQAVEGL